jgi:hypothetical protein
MSEITLDKYKATVGQEIGVSGADGFIRQNQRGHKAERLTDFDHLRARQVR